MGTPAESTAEIWHFLFSLGFPVGEVYEFCVHHLMELDDPRAIFPMEWRVI